MLAMICFLGTVPPGMAGYTSQYMLYYLWSDTIALATLFTNKSLYTSHSEENMLVSPRNVQAQTNKSENVFSIS